MLDVVHETMVGEDREAGPVEAEEGHELVVRARMAPRVFHRRLVAMVAVGDDHARAAQRGLDAGDRRRIGHAPEAMPLALEIARFCDRLAARRRCREERPARIRDEHEQQTRVRARCLQQPHAILLGPGMGALVRQHLAARVVGHLAQRDEPNARHLAAVDAICLVIRIHGRRRLARPQPLGEPRVERRARPRVLVGAALRLIAWIRDADDVRRAHRIEKILLLGADLIVRRRDDLAEIALAIDRIAVTVERPHAH